LEKLINDRLDELDKESFLNERQTVDPKGYEQELLLIEKTHVEIENRKAHAALAREREREQNRKAHAAGEKRKHVRHKTRGNVFLWFAYDHAIEDMKRIRQIWRKHPELKKQNGVWAPSALEIAAKRWGIKNIKDIKDPNAPEDPDVLNSYKKNASKNRRR